MEDPAQNSEGTARLAPYRFKPGQSGNPGGRPKRKAITDILTERLGEAIPESMRKDLPPLLIEVFGVSPTFGELLAFRMMATAAKGDMYAMGTILDRVEGKAVQSVKHSGEVVTKVVVNI